MTNTNTNVKEFKRGDIYLVDLGNSKGSIQGFKRPVVIVSNNLCNFYSQVIHICPLTSVATKSKLPTHSFVSKDTGLLKDSIALCEQVMPITKDSVGEKIGVCDEETMKRIDRGISIQFSLVYKEGRNNYVYA